MDRAVDLDEAVAAIADRWPVWQTAGLVVKAVTWREEAPSWLQQLETDDPRPAIPTQSAATCSLRWLMSLARPGCRSSRYFETGDGSHSC
jgi:hypothetical protein